MTIGTSKMIGQPLFAWVYESNKRHYCSKSRILRLVTLTIIEDFVRV